MRYFVARQRLETLWGGRVTGPTSGSSLVVVNRKIGVPFALARWQGLGIIVLSLTRGDVEVDNSKFERLPHCS